MYIHFELCAEVDKKQQLYLLLFRGILFAFPVWNVVSPIQDWLNIEAVITVNFSPVPREGWVYRRWS